MSLNWKEINAVLLELSLEGSFIQQIVQPAFDSIALYTYKAGSAKTVLICLAPGVCRMHETRQKIPKTEKPLRFMEFLKSRVKGAKIIECAQVEQERIVRIVCAREEETIILYVRLWSNAANVIATDTNGIILDSLYRRPKKNEVTGGVFTPLPASREAGAVEYIVRDFSELARSLVQGTQENEFDFSTLSLNQKIDLWYRQYAGKLSLDALISQAQKLYASKRSKMQNALARLEGKRADFLHAEQWKHQGDLILSFGHTGYDSDFLECTDYETGQPVSIKIDPKKSVQENAAAYYTVYKKAMSGIEELEHDIARAKKELLELDERYGAMLQEQNPIRLQQLIYTQNKPKQQTEKKRPGITYHLDGWTFFAGRTSAENDELLRHHVKGQDMWLHTRDWAGGYVFIKNRPGKTVPLDILLYAGNLALHHSKARAAGQADLYYTQVKHLRRAKNAPKGTVLPTHEKNIFIKRDSDKLKKLEDCVVEF